MESPIADRTLKCLNTFENLQKTLPTFSQFEDRAGAYIVDGASRLRLWAANLGAFHRITDAKSADHRLRSSKAVLAHLTDVLDELQETLEDVEAITSGTRTDQSFMYTGSQIDNDNDAPTSELHELCVSVPDLITSLFKISILVRKNTTRDRYAKAIAANYDHFLPEFDIRHVADKFPKTAKHPWLKDRLGHAITKRRQYLRYVRDHQNKIAHMPSNLSAPAAHQPQRAATVAPSRPSENEGSGRQTLALTTASTFEEPEMVSSISYDIDKEFEDDRSNATSFVSSKASDEESGKLRVVRLQELQNNGQEFECPYCRGIVRVRQYRSWKKHVFRDLRAYVCTFEDCTDGLFEDKHSWFKHELDNHRRQWVCIACPARIFNSPGDLRRHLKHYHKQDGDLQQTMNSVLEASSRPVREVAASACPFCDEWDRRMRDEAHDKGQSIPRQHQVMMPLEQFKRHLAGHQEQLALFAITPSWKKEIDSEDDSKDSTSEAAKRKLALNRLDDNAGQEWTTEELAAIDRLCRLWANRDVVIHHYLTCDKNEIATDVLLRKKFENGSRPASPIGTDRSYALRPKSFFKPGTVFKLGYHDPRETSALTEVSEMGDEGLFSNYRGGTRLFLVLEIEEESFAALPIMRYMREEGERADIDLSKRYIIYTSFHPPSAKAVARRLVPHERQIPVIDNDPRDQLGKPAIVNIDVRRSMDYRITARYIGTISALDLMLLLKGYEHKTQKQPATEDSSNLAPETSSVKTDGATRPGSTSKVDHRELNESLRESHQPRFIVPKVAWQCLHCSFKERQEHHLRQHLYQRHRDLPIYRCNQCSQEFFKRGEVRRHCRTLHGQERGHEQITDLLYDKYNPVAVTGDGLFRHGIF